MKFALVNTQNQRIEKNKYIYIYIYVYVYITLCDINQTGKGLARTLANLGIKIGSNAINSVLGEK